MTKYTAEDFARAGVAYRPPMHNLASEHQFALLIYPNGDHCWSIVKDGRVDSDRVSVEWLMASGWRPLYDKNDLPRGTDSLTAREHLEKAWEKAHEVDVIPAGADYLWRTTMTGLVGQGVPSKEDREAVGVLTNIRLLDPPPAPAWHNARIIEVDGCQWARREDLARGVEWIALRGIPTRLTTAEIAAYGDVTVIVGADA